MKKPKFNIGDKVGVFIEKEVDGILMRGYIEWYVISVYMEISESQDGDSMREYSYGIGNSMSVYNKIKHFTEDQMNLIEKVKYEDE